MASKKPPKFRPYDPSTDFSCGNCKYSFICSMDETHGCGLFDYSLGQTTHPAMEPGREEKKMMDIKTLKKANYHVTMPGGSVWSIPVSLIAENRAKEYAHEFDGDLSRSLEEDTWVLFRESTYEISDWARNNMNWSDVAPLATRVEKEPPVVDWQEGWINGDVEVVPPASATP